MPLSTTENTELKEKLKKALFRRLDPKNDDDRALINSEDLPRLIEVFLSL